MLSDIFASKTSRNRLVLINLSEWWGEALRKIRNRIKAEKIPRKDAMSQQVDFTQIRKDKENFSSAFALENEIFGNHPYVRSQCSKENLNSNLKILFVCSLYEDEKLDSLTQKIIESFGLKKTEFEIVYLTDESSSLVGLNMEKYQITLFFDIPDEIDDISEGLIKPGFRFNDYEFTAAKIWSAVDISQNPESKRDAWTLIKKIKNLLTD